MRRHSCALTVIATASAVAYAVTTHGVPRVVAQEPASELAAARAVIGAPAALEALKSLVLEGTIQNLSHNTGTLGPKERLEIRILLPDHYLRVVRGTRVVRTYGFSGTTSLRGMRPVAPGPFTVRSAPDPDAVDAERATLARLMLGIAADTGKVFPIQFRAGSAREGVRALEASGSDGFAARLDLAPESRAPLQVRYEDEVSFPVAGGTERNVGYARVAGMPPRENAEVALVFEDRRLVGGLRLPHRIRRVARGVTFEDITLERIVVNPPLTAKDFERP